MNRYTSSKMISTPYTDHKQRKKKYIAEHTKRRTIHKSSTEGLTVASDAARGHPQCIATMFQLLETAHDEPLRMNPADRPGQVWMNPAGAGVTLALATITAKLTMLKLS